MLLTGVFATEGGKGLVTGETALFVAHLKALVLVLAFVGVGAYLIYKLTDLITPLRVDEKAEEEGLDISQHDETIMIDAFAG
jgi:Amt family ammonium transporter